METTVRATRLQKRCSQRRVAKAPGGPMTAAEPAMWMACIEEEGGKESLEFRQRSKHLYRSAVRCATWKTVHACCMPEAATSAALEGSCSTTHRDEGKWQLDGLHNVQHLVQAVKLVVGLQRTQV